MMASAPNAVGSPAGGVRYQPLVIVLAAAAAGIVVDRFRPLPLGACGLWPWAAWRFGIRAAVGVGTTVGSVGAAVDGVGRQLHCRPISKHASSHNRGTTVQLPSQHRLAHLAFWPTSCCCWRWRRRRRRGTIAGGNLFAADDLGCYAVARPSRCASRPWPWPSPRAVAAAVPDPDARAAEGRRLAARRGIGRTT